MFIGKVVSMFRRDPLFGGVIVLLVLGGSVWAIAQAQVVEDPQEPTTVIKATPASLAPEPKSAERRTKSLSPELVSERYPDGVLKTERQVVTDEQFNYVNHGIYKEYDRKSNVIRTGEYRMGKQEGRWIQYFTAGEGSLFSGKLGSEFPGPFVSEASFSDGRLHGTWTITSRAGRKVIEWQFEHGVRHGRACWWHPNGRLRHEARYEHGLPTGPCYGWDSDGRLVCSVTYIDGRPLTKKVHWHNRSQKSYEGTVLPGRHVPELVFDWWNTYVTNGLANTNLPEQKHGRWIAWYPNGQTMTEGQYYKGTPMGQFVWHYENGQKQAEGQYANGLRTGAWITWHQNGMKESHGEYVAGAPAGRCSLWDASGKLVQNDAILDESDESKSVDCQDEAKEPREFDRLEQLTHSAWPFRQPCEEHSGPETEVRVGQRTHSFPTTRTAATSGLRGYNSVSPALRQTTNARQPSTTYPTALRQASRQSSVAIKGVRVIR